MSATAATAEGPAAHHEARVGTVVSGLMLVLLMAALDSTIVSTALPTIVRDLGGLEHISWVVTAYLLAQTAVTPLYGKLGDLYGRKVVLQAALVVFLAGSALCGAAQGMTELIAFRALQGLGGGGLLVGAQAAIGDVVSPRDRGRYSGYFGGVFGLATVVGPLLGGFLTSHLSWRWIFYVNLPIGALAFFVLAATLPAAGARVRHRIDYAGLVLLAAGLSAIVLAATLGGTTYGWGSKQIVGLGVAAILLLVAFVVVEGRAAEPVVPLRLFRSRVFAVASAVGFVVGFALFGAVTYLPVYQQVVRGLSPTESGLALLPLMGGLLVTSIGSGQVISRTGRYRMFPIIGTALTIVGLLLLSGLGSDTSEVDAAWRMAVLGAGLGCVMQVLVLAVQNAVGHGDLGVATSAATLFRLIGGSVGTAALGAVFTNRLRSNLADGLASKAAYSDAIDTVFFVGACVAVVAFLLSWLIEEVPLRQTVAEGSTGLGEAFAAPRPDDAERELLRCMSRTAGRERTRRFIEGVVSRADLDLEPRQAWLLVRLDENPDIGVDEIMARVGVEAGYVHETLAGLHARELVVAVPERPTGHELSPAGREAVDRLLLARQQRLRELLGDWPPADEPDVQALVARLSQDLTAPSPA